MLLKSRLPQRKTVLSVAIEALVVRKTACLIIETFGNKVCNSTLHQQKESALLTLQLDYPKVGLVKAAKTLTRTNKPSCWQVMTVRPIFTCTKCLTFLQRPNLNPDIAQESKEHLWDLYQVESKAMEGDLRLFPRVMTLGSVMIQ